MSVKKGGVISNQGNGAGGSANSQLGIINVAADFPTVAEANATAGRGYYLIAASVTDDDPTKTNTGDSFNAGEQIFWNTTESEWVIGSFLLPIATDSVLGGIKVGANLSINSSSGVLSLATSITGLTLVDAILSNKLLGDFTTSSRVLVQSNVANGLTVFSVVPNGTSTTSSLYLYNSSDTANSSSLRLTCGGSFNIFQTTNSGTGVVKDVWFYHGSNQALKLVSTGLEIQDGFKIGFKGTSYIDAGQTASDTLKIRAYDVDGASYTDFITLTSGNTPTMVMQSPAGGATQIIDCSIISPFILDQNGDTLLVLFEASTPVNYPVIGNSATGDAVRFAALGTDTDIDIDIIPKGAGQVTINSAVVPSITGTPTDNAIARFDSTTGKIQNSGVIISDSNQITGASYIGVPSLAVGSNGVNGSFVIYPPTASKGYLVIDCLDNTANYGITIQNDEFGQHTTLTIPDPEASTASFVLDVNGIISIDDLSFKAGLDHSVNIAAGVAGAAGNNLTIEAGSVLSGTDLNGGDLYLKSGGSFGTGKSSVTIMASPGFGSSSSLGVIALEAATFDNTYVSSVIHSTVQIGSALSGGFGHSVGILKLYPGAASKGNLLIKATQNAADYDLTITNAAFGQASTLTIPDPEASTGIIAVISGSITEAAIPKFSGTVGKVVSSGVTIDGSNNIATSGGASFLSGKATLVDNGSSEIIYSLGDNSNIGYLTLYNGHVSESNFTIGGFSGPNSLLVYPASIGQDTELTIPDPDSSSAAFVLDKATQTLTNKTLNGYNSTIATIVADATVPDVSANNIFITSANTGATAITNLANAKVGAVYIIVGGSNTNSSTIVDSGNFKLSAAFTAALDSTLTVLCIAPNTFVELSRSIN